MRGGAGQHRVAPAQGAAVDLGDSTLIIAFHSLCTSGLGAQDPRPLSIQRRRPGRVGDAPAISLSSPATCWTRSKRPHFSRIDGHFPVGAEVKVVIVASPCCREGHCALKRPGWSRRSKPCLPKTSRCSDTHCAEGISGTYLDDMAGDARKS